MAYRGILGGIATQEHSSWIAPQNDAGLHEASLEAECFNKALYSKIHRKRQATEPLKEYK
jgi:hypothetical protein